MKPVVQHLLVVVCVLTLTSNLTIAQDLQEQLGDLGREAAVGYISPLLQGWGADLNSGFYHTADLHEVLGFDIGVKVALVRISDDDKTFTFDLPPTINYQGYPLPLRRGIDYPERITMSTAVGEEKETEVKTIGGYLPPGRTVLTLPGGFNIPWVPLTMPQVAIGLPFGFEVVGRLIPTVSVGDAGKFNYWGFGLRYDVDQWLPKVPVDIAAHFVIQRMGFKSKDDQEIFTGRATAFGFSVSKSFSLLTLYGGFQLEGSTLSLNDYIGYDAASGTTVQFQGFDIKGKNSTRLTIGASLLLLVVNIHADYSIAKTSVITLGVGFSFR